MSETDARRKLSQLDYQRIRFLMGNGYTTRQVASIYNVSTKYAHKLRDARVNFTDSGTTTFVISESTFTLSELQPYTESCSGCGMRFPHADLMEHFAIWTSGGTKELDCQTVMAK